MFQGPYLSPSSELCPDRPTYIPVQSPCSNLSMSQWGLVGGVKCLLACNQLTWLIAREDFINLCMYLLFRSAPGRKRVYIQEDAHIQETTYSSVEEYAINHYKSKGYTEGD
jgi:hypothetical protein